jgi:hypothetical protein
MIMAFRRHDYDLDNFERCEEHGCPLVQVAENVEPECLVEWVAERVVGMRVVDVVPPSTDPADYPHPALVLEGGMILPVVKALDTGTGQAAEVNLALTGWAVNEVAYVVSDGPGGRMEYVTVELTDGQHAPILAGLNLDILIYLLEDAQFRRIEP